MTLIDRRNTLELFRDHAADLFEHHTGSSWRPRAGSMANHRSMTAAIVDHWSPLARHAAASLRGRFFSFALEGWPLERAMSLTSSPLVAVECARATRPLMA
jgi:hypothetical protein